MIPRQEAGPAETPPKPSGTLYTAGTDSGALTRGRKVLRLGLGALWMLDGLLQLQPGMFAMDMIGPTMQPTATPEPAWLSALLAWSIHHASVHLAPFNWTVAVLELSVGAILISGRRPWVTCGLWLSIALGAVLWLFGESLGQLLSGSATVLGGAPGAMLLYAIGAGLVLAPASLWRRDDGRGLDGPTAVVAAVLILGVLLQLQRLFWTPLGLAQPFGNGAMMPQPQWLRAVTGGAAALALRSPVPFNAAIISVLVALAGVLAYGPANETVFWTAICVLAVVWTVGQDAGMLASGMATDPNSAPLLALLLWAGRAQRRSRVRR